MLAKLFSKKNEEKKNDTGSELSTIEERLLNRIFSMYQQNQLTDDELLRLCAQWYAIQQLPAEKFDSAAPKAPFGTEANPSPADLAPIEDISHSTASTVIDAMASNDSMLAQEAVHQKNESTHHLQIQSVPVGSDQNDGAEQSIPVRTAQSGSTKPNIADSGADVQKVVINTPQEDDQTMQHIPVGVATTPPSANRIPVSEAQEVPLEKSTDENAQSVPITSLDQEDTQAAEAHPQEGGVSPAQRLRQILKIDHKSSDKEADSVGQSSETQSENKLRPAVPTTMMHTSAFTSSSRAMPFDLNEPEVVIPLTAPPPPVAPSEVPEGMVPFQPSKPEKSQSPPVKSGKKSLDSTDNTVQQKSTPEEEVLPTVSQLALEVPEKTPESGEAGTAKQKVSYKPKLKFR